MVLSAYIIINILVAFVIDVYTQIERSQRKGIEERKAIIEYGRKAINAENKMRLLKNAKQAISAFKWAKKKKKTDDPATADAATPAAAPDANSEPSSHAPLLAEKRPTTDATLKVQAKFKSALKKKGERNFQLDQVEKKEQTNQTILDQNENSRSSDSSSEELEEDR